ncbi:lysophospholipid acyltransferase 5-like [Tropilaelaps mercedesae]|uniref:Lysophospholipid acyltransferase 5 n=1 Tax=Tropilaelaps mercedesae TaxID=418985 RepID=A0A1V9X039_9ACAR|nr:lysophospholipid acyltransferase 5-like [Tropilaelaps mercedesae]
MDLGSWPFRRDTIGSGLAKPARTVVCPPGNEGYPLALIYRRCIWDQRPTVQHLFFTVTGLVLIIFNYRWDVVHSLSNIAVVYAIMWFAGRTRIGLAASFIFAMCYLLAGYLYTATENYDIKWTMPQCILCLRLIGVAFDYYDGGVEDFNSLPSDRRATALKDLPSPLEMLGHSYYFGGCMVGPQFSMQRYRDFVQGTLWSGQKTKNANSITYSMNRLVLGVIAMAFYHFGAIYFNDTIILSEEYLTEWSWPARWAFLGVYGTVALHKYVACWLMAGANQWNGLENIGLWHFETTTNFDGFIRAFNINTNKWVAQYIFKRLKFLGNKQLSQLIALGFLALWHGFHPGYYLCFVNEFLVMKFERDVTQIIDSFPQVRGIVYHDKLQWLRLAFMKVYVATLFGYCLVPFVLLKPSKFLKVYATFYYIPSILLVLWFAGSFKVMAIVRGAIRQSTNGLSSDKDTSSIRPDGGKDIASDDLKASAKHD